MKDKNTYLKRSIVPAILAIALLATACGTSADDSADSSVSEPEDDPQEQVLTQEPTTTTQGPDQEPSQDRPTTPTQPTDTEDIPTPTTHQQQQPAPDSFVALEALLGNDDDDDDGGSGGGGGGGGGGPVSPPPSPFLEDVEEVEVGSNHNCAIVGTDRTAYCWGQNDFGQLGDGTTDRKLNPTQVIGITGRGSLTGVQSISAGNRHTCAIVGTTRLAYCWGRNFYGQLGDDSSVESITPTQVVGTTGSGSLTGVQSISAGNRHTCAVLGDGSAYCWGQNDFGQLGDDTIDSKDVPTQVVGVTGSGSLLTDVQSISAGNRHTCAVLGDGSAYCWGQNDFGQLGDDTIDSKDVPTQVVGVTGSGSLLTDIQSISAGGFHTCATVDDGDNDPLDAGDVYCWGLNGDGQLGDGTTDNKDIPTQVIGTTGGGTLTGVNSISAGAGYTCTIVDDADGNGVSDKSAYCWGQNPDGQLGDGTGTDKLIPTQVVGTTGGGSLTDARSISAGSTHTCAIVGTTRLVYCWGLNNDGQLGDGIGADRFTSTKVRASSRTFTGEPIPDPTLNNDIDDNVFLADVRSISAGIDHTCAIVGADKVAYCWGGNFYGQLGIGTRTRTNKLTLTQVVGTTGSGSLTEVESIVATSNAHTCAIVGADKVAYCWGNNLDGQLGDGTTDDRLTPTQVVGTTGSGSLTGVHSISANGSATALGNRTCAIVGTTRSAYCWGQNNFGQLGDGTSINRPAPTQVVKTPDDTNTPNDETEFLTGVESISAGEIHTCAIVDDADRNGVPDKTAYCWGLNFAGGLGDGTTGSKSIPTQVVKTPDDTNTPNDETEFLTGVESISAGYLHTCAIVGADKVAYCWGSGPGIRTELIPTQVVGTTGSGSLTGVHSISASNGATTFGSHTCAIVGTTRLAYCWGGNFFGQLGDGTTGSKSIPTQVVKTPDDTNTPNDETEFLTGVNSISAGAGYTCAIVDDADGNGIPDKSAYCWGNNDLGQLGNGSHAELITPTQVKAPEREIEFLTTTDFVSAGWDAHTCAIVGTDSSAYCWGENDEGQLGDGTRINRPAPTQVKEPEEGNPLTNVISISTGRNHTCAIVGTDSSAYCWGNNDFGQLGDGTDINKFIPTQVKDSTGNGFLTGVEAISTAGTHTCAIVGTNKDAYCWGANSSGQLGDNTIISKDLPIQVIKTPDSDPVTAGDQPEFLTDVQSISTGWPGRGSGLGSTCAIVGTNKDAYCWGDNEFGQLGIGTEDVGGIQMTVDKSIPTQVVKTAAVGATPAVLLTDVQSISVGAKHTCAIIGATAKAAYCWGVRSGIFGVDSIPIQVEDSTGNIFLTGIASISAGGSYTCVIVEADKSAYCWGLNDVGQLGDGTTDNKFGPIQIVEILDTDSSTPGNQSKFLTQVQFISAGGEHTCATAGATDRSAYCWGNNDEGQLGDGTTGDKDLPSRVRAP